MAHKVEFIISELVHPNVFNKMLEEIKEKYHPKQLMWYEVEYYER
tara:strand:+ start:531 stop:665 length:135 start_codon:yes stop_codon:yes gene_type:complete